MANSVMAASATSVHCCVPLCNGDGRYHPDLVFHRFPKSPKKRWKWFQLIRDTLILAKEVITQSMQKLEIKRNGHVLM